MPSKLLFKYSIFLSGCVLFLATISHAESNCTLELQQLEPGIVQIELGDVDVKIEARNNIVKMKIPQAFETHNWTWASTEQGAASIEGIIERDGEKGILSELVAVRDGNNGINWGLFHSNNPFSDKSFGKAYFVISGTLYCTFTTAGEWKNSVQKVLGSSLGEKRSIEALSPEAVYRRLGLS